MKLNNCATISDLCVSASRRLPGFAKAFLESGTGDDVCRDRNLTRFQRERLDPLYLAERSEPQIAQDIFGERYNAPIGIAPIGMASVVWSGAERAMVATARTANIPFCLSTVANLTIEESSSIHGSKCWFQLYTLRDRDYQFDLLDRCKAVGIDTILVTVDVPVHNLREGMRRTGLSMPLRITPSLMLQAAKAPLWCFGTLVSGLPSPKNLERYIAEYGGDENDRGSRFLSEQFGRPTTLNDLRAIRAHWSGNLVVKGVLTLQNAREAIDVGADGIVISNHGGRQLDAAHHPLDVIGMIRDGVSDNCVIGLDSGIRSGSDIAVALRSGADFVLAGRPFLYGSVFGKTGTDKAASIFSAGLENVMAQIGAETLEDIADQHSKRQTASSCNC